MLFPGHTPNQKNMGVAWERGWIACLSIVLMHEGMVWYSDAPLLPSAAGPWLKYRGHLDNISNNMFLTYVQ